MSLDDLRENTKLNSGSYLRDTAAHGIDELRLRIRQIALQLPVLFVDDEFETIGTRSARPVIEPVDREYGS